MLTILSGLPLGNMVCRTMDDDFDALGPRPDRRPAFRGQMLAREPDPVLEAIVAEAAEALHTPIAMVNLVLDHVQRFRAHLGLPEELAVAGATERRASFCQFVVRDGRPFEVIDAATDPRVPQYLVHTYGIRAYLGMPLVVNDVVVGTLCVLCQQPRTFTDADRRLLRELSERANRRLSELGAMSRESRRALSDQSAAPALDQLQRVVALIGREASTTVQAIEGLRPLLQLVERSLETAVDPELLRRALRTAQEALEDGEHALYEVEAAHGDAHDGVAALGRLYAGAPLTDLVEVTLAARELARSQLAPKGGAYLPDIGTPVYITTSQPLAVSLVSGALSMLAERLPEGTTGGLTLDVVWLGPQAALRVEGPALSEPICREVAEELDSYVAQEGSVLVEAGDPGLFWVRFTAADPVTQTR